MQKGVSNEETEIDDHTGNQTGNHQAVSLYQSF
jgi:hypothetical protein